MSDATAKNLPIPSASELKAMDKHVGIVHVISGKTAKGEDFYAYVAVDPSRYEEFLKLAQQSAPMNIEEYGLVLKNGFGKEPSSDVVAAMEKDYGVDHHFIENLRKAFEESQKNS